MLYNWEKMNIRQGANGMALTEIQVRQAKPAEKTYSMGDGRGLILEVRPNGVKRWQTI